MMVNMLEIKMQDLYRAIAEYRNFVLSKASACNQADRINQGIIGIATEAGELLDALKKNMFQQRPYDITNLKEECGDLFFYFTELMSAIDTNLEEVMEMNRAKLAHRYIDKFNKDESINRDLDKEREILEQSEKGNKDEKIY